MRISWLALAALLTLSPAALAQGPIGADLGSSVQTREDLTRLLADYEEIMASTVYSASVRESIREDAQRIRDRLENGDFRVGDRVALYVQGEETLPDTVAVQPGPMISLPLFGEISLRGVLRSEITTHLTEALSRFIRDPVVAASGHMRLSVLGEVGSPGFYTMPAEMLLSEALMVAGGPGSAADLSQVRIERGTARLIEGAQLQEAMREGLTLDQLNLQAGDQIVVPPQGAGVFSIGNITAIVGLIGAISVFFVVR